MEYKKKLELLAKYDFSAQKSRFERPGFGNVLADIFHTLDYADHIEPIKRIDLFSDLNSCYAILTDYYNKINFDELDKNDKDFKFFFDYRKKLIQLGQEINNFQVEGFVGKEYSVDRVKNLIRVEMMDKLDYREEILRKNGLHTSI